MRRLMKTKIIGQTLVLLFCFIGIPVSLMPVCLIQSDRQGTLVQWFFIWAKCGDVLLVSTLLFSRLINKWAQDGILLLVRIISANLALSKNRKSVGLLLSFYFYQNI